jgi:hypothetical protein
MGADQGLEQDDKGSISPIFVPLIGGIIALNLILIFGEGDMQIQFFFTHGYQLWY